MAKILNNVEKKKKKFETKALGMTNELNMPHHETLKVLDLFSL